MQQHHTFLSRPSRGSSSGAGRARRTFGRLSFFAGFLGAVFFLPLTGGYAHAAEAPVVLVWEGGAEAVIVVPSNADEQSLEAADVLAAFIERMSGVRLPVLPESELDVHVDGGRIVEGQPGEAIQGDEDVPGEERPPVRQPLQYVLVGPCALTAQLGVAAGELGVGGLRLKTTGNAVVLLGGPAAVAGEPGRDSGGVVYAAIELLEQLGCRYLWPGQTGLVVPRRATVSIAPLDLAYSPVIRGRGIRWGRTVGTPRFDKPLGELGMTAEEWLAGQENSMGEKAPAIDWMRWQRLAEGMPSFKHAGAGLRDGDQLLEVHPEWFALQADGTRDQDGDSRWRLCKSNPALIAHVAQDIIRQVDEDPTIELVSLDSNDGGSRTSFCLCEACEALDHPAGEIIQIHTYVAPDRPGGSRVRKIVDHVSLTDRMVYYWNSVAEQVAARHPHLLFGVSAYSAWKNPPVARRLHPNLVLRYVPSTTEGWDGWAAMGARRVFWRPNILLTGYKDGRLRSYVGDLAARFHFFVDVGMIQTDFDSIVHHWAVHGINYYAAARLCWNPGLTAEEIIADYAQGGFGAGAPFIEQYFQRLEEMTAEGITPTFTEPEDYSFTPEVAAELHALLNEAEGAAADPEVAARVAFLRLGLNYTVLQERLGELARLAANREPWDREEARRLVNLNVLLTRYIPLDYNPAINTVYLTWATGHFARFAPVGGRTLEPSDPAMLKRLDNPDYRLTGEEQRLDDMLEAFDL